MTCSALFKNAQNGAAGKNIGAGRKRDFAGLIALMRCKL